MTERPPHILLFGVAATLVGGTLFLGITGSMDAVFDQYACQISTDHPMCTGSHDHQDISGVLYVLYGSLAIFLSLIHISEPTRPY